MLLSPRSPLALWCSSTTTKSCGVPPPPHAIPIQNSSRRCFCNSLIKLTIFVHLYNQCFSLYVPSCQISPLFLQKNHTNLGIWFKLMEYGRCFNLILISKISKYHHLLLLLFNHLHSFWRCSCFFDELLPMVSGHMYHWKTNQINS